LGKKRNGFWIAPVFFFISLFPQEILPRNSHLSYVRQRACGSLTALKPKYAAPIRTCLVGLALCLKQSQALKRFFIYLLSSSFLFIKRIFKI
jgi:hypothetical protein